MAEDRYFAFLNAEPGSALIYLNRGLNGSLGAAFVPVTNGVATFLDLSKISSKTLNGVVYDASSFDSKPLASVSVSVLGQPKAVVETDENGRFSISNLVTFGSMPLFLDLDKSREYTQRYKISGSQSEVLELFLLNQGQVNHWKDQLEGGVSSEKGVMVGAIQLPSEITTNTGVFPVSQVLNSHQGKNPEIYSLHGSGKLLDHVALDSEKPRFFGADVPEGLILNSLEDQSQHTVWSDLIVASRNVVNVIQK
jgi:hypothetical protein